ncbi:Sulfate permease [hydrothermal vent metagenome]|uniref:Sulfate permease n=1 Tax=hydrothermal vent metagenome TaxID=652676 RepID=A0A3B0Y4A3_9ZZZZ
MISLKKEEWVAVNGDNGSLILECSDTPLRHWLLTDNGVEARLNVNQFDIAPEILVRDNKLFIGVEQGIFVLDIDARQVISVIPEVSNVQWIEEGAQKFVAFAAEDEVIVLDNLGNMLWRKNLPDVIEMTNIVDENILITDMSGEEYEMNLTDGNKV